MNVDNEGLLWLTDAACADMEIDDFFVEAGHAISEDTLRVCRSCPVRVECVKHVYNMQVTGGYFGGMSPGQRRERTMDEAVRFVEESIAADEAAAEEASAKRAAEAARPAIS